MQQFFKKIQHEFPFFKKCIRGLLNFLLKFGETCLGNANFFGVPFQQIPLVAALFCRNLCTPPPRLQSFPDLPEPGLLDPGWKEMLKNAPVIFGTLTLGGIIIGIPLAVLSYYLSYAAVNKYQQRTKVKVKAQKVRLANTKVRVKKKIRRKSKIPKQ